MSQKGKKKVNKGKKRDNAFVSPPQNVRLPVIGQFPKLISRVLGLVVLDFPSILQPDLVFLLFVRKPNL